MYELVLASGSPRRKEILTQCNIPFTVCVSNTEEIIRSTKPEDVVKELALQKASDVYEKCKKHKIVVLGADTVVAYKDEILGKPKDQQDAFRMIQMLQNNKHFVYTGVALIVQEEARVRTINFAVKTVVEVMTMSEEEIWKYIETGEPMDKAGAYGIQGNFARFVKGIQGDYYNVVGLPVNAIYETLKREGINLK